MSRVSAYFSYSYESSEAFTWENKETTSKVASLSDVCKSFEGFKHGGAELLGVVVYNVDEFLGPCTPHFEKTLRTCVRAVLYDTPMDSAIWLSPRPAAR